MKRGTPNHPKTLWLKAGLGLSKYETVGLLELIFHFVAQHAPQGDIGKWTNAQIAEGVEWTRNPDELVAQLTGACYFDASKKYRLVVHEWHIHADQGVKKFLMRNGLAFVTVSGRRPPKAGQRPPIDEDTAGHVRTAVSLPLSVSVPLSLPSSLPVGTEEHSRPPTPATPAEERTVALAALGPPIVPLDAPLLSEDEIVRREINAQTVALEYRLLVVVGRLSERLNRDSLGLMREVTAYKKRDGTVVPGRSNPSGLTSERLEKSIEDAEGWLADLDKAAAPA